MSSKYGNVTDKYGNKYGNKVGMIAMTTNVNCCKVGLEQRSITKENPTKQIKQ